MTKDNTAEGKPKNLAEFIDKAFLPVVRDYERMIARRLANHLLDVTREWCDLKTLQYFEREGELVIPIMRPQGLHKCGCALKEFLESYCAPVEDLKK